MQDARTVDRHELRQQIQQTIQDARAATEAADAQSPDRVIIRRDVPGGFATTEPAWNPADMPPRAQEFAIASLFEVERISEGQRFTTKLRS